MSIKLFDHNRAAYDSALAMLRLSGKAVIIHPTGTGKSFIGFKLAEEHPKDRVLWLSPSEYIVKTQLENLKKESGAELKNITFITYIRLMLMDKDEISALSPDWIIMDEFHRCGAEKWSGGVDSLLAAYPKCPILGLSATNVRYLDGQRDMAAELFDGNIASEMTLGEAIVRGILLKPKYVVALYDYEDQLNSYQKKISMAKNTELRNTNQRKLDALRRSLDSADGIDEILYKHITDKRGKYIVFCSSVEDVVSLRKLARQWFWKIDDEPHIYSVYSYFDESDDEFRAFKADDSGHIKLLYCVDMLNEGVHVDNISGVILCRLTVSPTVYKQQIGRALSASKTNEAVIFDFVNNFKNLCSVSSLEQEVRDAAESLRTAGMEKYIVTDGFTVVDEVRDSVELFRDLEGTLNVSWEEYFELARQYCERNGNIDIPVSYRTDEGVALGQWLCMQKMIRRGKAAGLLTPERISKLDSIGICWETPSESRWGALYAHAAEYYAEHGDLNVKTSYKSPDGYELGSKICDLRKIRKRRGSGGMLTEEHIRLLDEMGMLWAAKSSWDKYFPAAKRYHAEHGDLNVPNAYVTEDGLKLGEWISRCRRGALELSASQRSKLELMGFDQSGRDAAWDRHYNEIKEFYRQNGHLNISYKYQTADGFKLGQWLGKQRRLRKSGELPESRVRRLSEIGMV